MHKVCVYGFGVRFYNIFIIKEFIIKSVIIINNL